MSLARLPITGSDANTWSDILNRSITQTNSALNGAFNSFDLFSQRPTNLSADEAGKTYLYTQTGNWHEWSGTDWKIQNGSFVNIKDYGALGDGVTDDTVAIQKILDTYYGRTIFFPAGNFLANLEFKTTVDAPLARPNNIVGQGNKCTTLKSFTSDGYALTSSAFDNWRGFEIKDISIIGDMTQGGIQFGKPNSSDPNTSSISSNLFLNNVDFINLDVCINKRYGNIGNRYTNCSFYSANYHYIAKEHGNYMHAGIDTFFCCHFLGAQKASVYFDSPGGSTGQTTFRDCVFEGNPGMCIFSKGYGAGNATFNPVLKLENVWWENNGLAFHEGPVQNIINIFGTNYPNAVMHLERTNALIDNTSILDFTLVETTLKIKNPLIGSYDDKITKDDRSLVVVDGLRAYASNNKGYYVQDILVGGRDAGINGDFNCTFDTKPRLKISKSNANLLFAESFANSSSYKFEGDPQGYTNSVSVLDGVLFDNCAEMTLKPGINYYGPIYTTIPKDKFIFWSINTKNFTGNCTVEIANPANTAYKLANSLNNAKPNIWNSYSGITNTFNPGGQPFPVSLVMSNGNSIPTTVRFSALQILLFDSNEECIKYSDSLTYSCANLPKQLYQENIPTVGLYNKSDIIYNTNPTPGSYVGWICTTAGIPGIWKGFGLIEN